MSLFLAAEHVFGSSAHRSVVYVFVVMPVARIQCRNLIAEIVNMQISSVDRLVAVWCLFICFDDVPLIFLCFNASASDATRQE